MSWVYVGGAIDNVRMRKQVARCLRPHLRRIRTRQLDLTYLAGERGDAAATEDAHLAYRLRLARAVKAERATLRWLGVDPRSTGST